MTTLYELEDELEALGESEFETEEEAFFGSLARLATRAGAPPALRRVAAAAGRAARGGLSTLGNSLLSGAGTRIGRGLGGNQQLFAPQGEAEWEDEAFVNPIRRWYPDAMMEHLGRAAAEAESEAEAVAFLAPLVPLAARFPPRVASTVLRTSPQLIRGIGNIAGTLMRGPGTRPLIRTLPTIVQRTTTTLARHARQGLPVTPRTAVDALARQAAAVIGNPHLAARIFRRSQALDQRLHQANGTGQHRTLAARTAGRHQG